MPELFEQTDMVDETMPEDEAADVWDEWDGEVAPPPKSPVPLIAVVVACALTACVMLFGEGTLWAGDAQADPSVPAGQGDPAIPDTELPGNGSGSSGNSGNGGGADASGFSDELLSTYEVKSTSDHAPAWANNVRLAANSLNGTIIPAGESLSFNEVVGEISKDRGYQEVAVMLGNMPTTVVGGGVSQVATALYDAALYAGLDVEDRHANAVAVDYAAMGMDAYVSSDGKDLVIRNNTSYPVRVEAATSGSSVTVSLFGVPTDPHVARDVTSRVVDMYARPAEEVYDDPESQGLLPTDSVRFYVAEVYVATYRDGQQESNRLVSSDTYQVVGEQAATLES